MSFAAEGWAWEQQCPSSAAKAVLVCLAWHANKEGASAYPSIPKICRLTHLVERTVRKALEALRAAGLIEPHLRDGDAPDKRRMSTEYRLKMRELPPANLHPPLEEDPPVNLPPPGGNSATPPLANMQGNLSNEPRKEPRKKKKSPPSPPRVTAEDIAPVVAAWNEMAKQADLSQVVGLSDKRLTHIRTRLEEHGIDTLLMAVDRVGQSPFLHGTGDRGFKATFDWLFGSPTNFLKTLEGNYSPRQRKSDPNNLTGAAGLLWKFRQQQGDAGTVESTNRFLSFSGDN